MRVLHVIQRYWPFQGGSEGYFQALSERLAARGDTVSVFTTDAWDLEHFWAPGKRRIERPACEVYHGVTIRRFPVRRPPLPPIYFRILRRLMSETSELAARTPLDPAAILAQGGRLSPWVPALTAALRALPAGAFDLVHSTNITLEAPIQAATAYASRAGIPSVITPFVHLGEPGSRQIVRYYTMHHQLRLLRRANRVVVQTDLEARALVARGVPPDHLAKIGVGVDPLRVLGGDAARFRRCHGLDSAVPLVLFVGALARDKGAAALLEAGRRLWAAGRDVRLVLIGSTTLPDFTAAYATLSESERARVLLLGFTADEEKRDAFAACTVFAMPSRTDTFGITFLEAWLYDKPVIGARAGGVPEVIADGEDGYLVPFGDSAALAGRLTVLLTDPARAAQMGAAGHAKVLREHLWQPKLDRLLALYDDLAGHGAVPPATPLVA